MFTTLASSRLCNYSKKRLQFYRLENCAKNTDIPMSWVSGQQPRLTQNGKNITFNTDNFAPLVVPGLSSSSGTSASSTATLQDLSSSGPAQSLPGHSFIPLAPSDRRDHVKESVARDLLDLSLLERGFVRQVGLTVLQGADRRVYLRVRETTRKDCEQEAQGEVDPATMTVYESWRARNEGNCLKGTQKLERWSALEPHEQQHIACAQMRRVRCVVHISFRHCSPDSCTANLLKEHQCHFLISRFCFVIDPE